MVCALSPNQEARLLKKISKDLLEGIASKTPFELDSYIKSIYDQVKKVSDKEDLALTYAALVPRSLKVIFGADSEIDEYLENSIGAIQKKSKEFADFDNVIKQIVGDPAEAKKIKAALKKTEEQKKAEEDEEKVRPSAVAITVFSELPNSFNTTVGNPDLPVFEFSYSYLRHHAAQTTVDSDVTGIYLTMGRAQDLLPESILSQFKREPQYVHILTDFDGNVLYFNDQFEQVSQEEGQPVFFNERIKESQIQSIPEIMKAYGFETEEQAKEFLSAQIKESEEKKEYILSGSGKRVIQNIIGANHSYIKTTGEKKNLNTVGDLSMYPIRIDQEEKKTAQGYVFDRGAYMMPIKFKMRPVKSDMEFVETAADILLGNVVDSEGKASPVKLLEYRNKFYKVFLGNNSRLNFKDGVVYVDKNPTTSKEEIIDAITTNTVTSFRTNEPIQVDNVFQVYKTTLSEVPFYTIVDGQIRLSPSGMTGTQYRKFIQDHAYTTMDINESGQFNEFGGYYIFAPGTYRQVQGKLSTKKPAKVLDSPTFKTLDKKPVYDLEENTVNTLRSATGTPHNFGNPFRGSKRYGMSDTIDNKLTYGTIAEAVNAFKQWLDGTAHQDVNPEKRDWILEQIESGQLNGKTLLYYKPKSVEQLDGTKIKGYYSHADYLADLVNSTVPQEEVVETPSLEKELEDIITDQLKEKVFKIGKIPFEKTELEDINVYVKKEDDNNFSIGVDNKGKNIFGLVTATLDFQRRDLDSNSIYVPNPKGFILWEAFLNSEVGKSSKAKVIIDNRFSIALGVLKALKNNDIEFVNFPERFTDNFKKEYTRFLKQEFSSVGFTDVTDNRLKTIQISIDDLIRIISLKNTEELTTSEKVTEENITKTEEEDFNFVESKKIDLDDTLKQFDKLKGQKLINAGVTEEQLKAAKEWYEKSPLKNHVSLAELFNAVNSANPFSIATFNAMGITLYKGADYSDLYHEAWHAFTQMFLTKAERDSLYKELRKRKGEFTDFEGNKLKYSDANDKQAEEVLAEEFREFMLSGGKKLKDETPVKKTIFQKILDILKLLFNVNTEDILARDQSSTLINDMFEALRVGNIRSTPLGVDNSQFTNLDKIKALTGEQQKYADELGYENSIKIVNLIDGLFSEFIDEKVNKGKDVNYTVAILSQPETRAVAYNYALSRIKDKVKELTEQINSLEETDPTGIELRKRRATLVFAIRNFANGSTNGEDINGDTLVNITAINSKPTGRAAGIVSYHMEKSKFLSFEDRYELLEASGEDRSKVDSKANPNEADNTTVNARDGYSHKSGNEVSMKELAANEVLYLIRSLFDYKTGKVIRDEFGFPKLGKFDENWNKIQKLVGGINNAEVMYKKMLASKDPVIKQLASKLGDPRIGITPGVKISQNRLMQSNLWTKFFEVFSSKRIPLVQLTVDIDTKSGNITVKPGRAQAEIDKISRDWDAQFTNPQNPNKFVITKAKVTGAARDKFTSNYLDVIGVVKAFEKTYKSNPIPFLRAIGMLVSDEAEIELALKTSLKVFPDAMMKSLQTIKTKLEAAPNSKFKIYRPSDLVKFQIEEGKTETSAYKELLTLESRYSETYGTAMVSNARGDAQYELSLRSTGANMIDYYNSASSLEALVANPAMNHLAPERNPWTNKLMIIRETFDPITGKRIGEKTEVGRQKSTFISLENSSGITVTLDQEFSELGIKSADADDTAQMLQQFYTMSLYGVSEATKHSDKSSVFFFRPQFASGKRHYIPSFKFASYSNLEDLETEKNFTDGNVAAVNQFVNYLAGEVERIYKLQNGDVSGNVLIGDKTYKEVGSDFVMFEDILQEETINKIKEKGIVADFLTFINDPANASLLEDINNDISDYLTDQVEEFRRDAAKVGLLTNDKLMAQVRKSLLRSSSLSSILSKPENQAFLDEAVMRNYVINQLIHTTEMTLLFYGDIALYNLAKEEFHKRNAGIAATGNFMRIDEAMLQILNSAGSNYAASAWYDKEKYGEAEAKVYGRTANTAVLQDSEIKSVYTDEYVEALIENEKTIRGVTELSNEVIEQIKTTLSPYNKLTEGDAQGWVSFDFYRAMRIALGKWDWYQETLYNKILRKEAVSTLDVIKFFPVEKMQYWGPLQTEGLNVVGFHKFSLMPLIPNVIEGTNLEILHNRMTQQNIDYALFQSGSKVNTITKDGKADQFYIDPSKQETNAVAFSDPAYRFTKNTIFLDYFKNQLETADQYKGKQIFSTQLRKLIEEGLMEQGVPTDFRTDLSLSARRTLWESLAPDSPDRMTLNYEKLINYERLVRSLTEYKVRELHRELGFGATDDITISENLINFVTKELSRQDLADHEIDFIRYNPVTKTLMYDLSIHPSAEKIEKLLTAVVYKRLIKQKVNGEALIQVSGAGFEPAKIRKATAEEKETYGSNGLPFYQKGKAMKVKIALQGDFKKLLKDEDVVNLAKKTGDALKALNILIKQDTWLNKGDNRKMVTIAGVRIPVQGFNSMEFAEVYEFLPESAGNMIIVPSEIVGKAGSDFDIDKLTMLFPSIVKTRKGLSLAKHSRAAENTAASVDLKARLKDLYTEKEAAYKAYQEFAKQYFANVPDELYRDYLETVNDLNTHIKIFKDQMLSYSIMGEEIPDHLYDDIQEYYEALDDIMKEFDKPVREYRIASLDPIQEQIDETKMTIAQASSKGIENDLLFAVVDIMSADRNFADLITPNSTDILQPIAEDLAKYTRDYDPFMSRTGKEFTFTKGGKKKKRIAGTRVIEIGYNRFKHVSNNIGKKTLGQGAVDNTYNTLFSRIGFYMNPTAELGSGQYTYTHHQTLRMPHHTIDTGAGEGISLSNLYTLPDKEGRVYRISNLISQAMNGWVDVAKDAWIFDIQANPELTGALLFMIQAGVPPKQAIYLISQPLVREYVKERRKIRSAFAKPLGDSIPNFMMYKNKAKANILGGYDFSYYTMPLKNVKSTILRKTVNELFGTAEDQDYPVLNTLPNKSESKTMRYAGIGSRETSPELLKEMTKAAAYLDSLGYTLQTGFTYKSKETGLDEEGADKAFSDGSKNKILFGPSGIRETKDGKTVSRVYDKSVTEKTYQVVDELHPAPERLTPGAKKLMSRNTNQIFGENLDSTVDFVLFYAKENPSNPMRPQGGTGQAVEMARRKGIPTINMADADWKKQLKAVLETGTTQAPSSAARKTYSGKVTSLQPNQIFVFGSNEGSSKGAAPTHGAGSAKIARDNFGAVQGQSRGLQGQSYAIVTKKFYDVEKSSTPQEIIEEIKGLYEYAKQNPTKEFLVSDYSKSNLNGYTGQEMADMFNAAGPIPSNIVFNENFDKLVNATQAPVSVKPQSFNPEIFSEDSLYKRLEQTADAYKSGTYSPTIDDYRRFVHFLEIEEMADATTKIKLGINVDTARTTNLFETREKLANIIDLYDQARFPSKMITALEKESPIGSFRVQEDIIRSVSNLFKIRDNQVFSNFVRDETPMFEDELHTRYPGAFKNKADFQSKLRNDFIPYIFQQWLYKPGRFSMYEPYKGLGIKESPEAAEIVPAGVLSRGAFLDTKTNKLNVDFSVLTKQFKESVYETEAYWNKLGFAPVSSFHFLTGNSELDYELFVKFLYERETLRAMIPYKKYKESENFKSRKEEILISGLLEGKKSSVSIDDLAGVRAYEEFLRDTALINKLNISFMFRDPSGYSSQLSTIDRLFPQLKQQYSVLNILSYKTFNGTFGISLNQKDMTSDDKSIYNDQLKKLADPNVQKVENPVDNDIISRMFSMLPIFSFVQTGMDSKSANSLAPIVDTTLYERLLFTALKESPNMFSSDTLGKYKLLFNAQYTTTDEAGERTSFKRKGFKNYYNNFFEEEKAREFTESAPYDPNVKLFSTQNKDLKVFAKNLIDTAKADSRKLFIFDDYLAAYVPSPKAIPGTVSISKNKKPIATYNMSVIKDMAGKGTIDPKQAVGFIVKKRPTILDESDFITDATLEKNKEAIDTRISIILDRMAEGYIPQFSESGVGNALLGISGREIKGQSGSITKETPPALQTYLYLSKELYRHFGYINPLAKQYEEMVELITEKQTITDDDVKNVLYSCFFK